MSDLNTQNVQDTEKEKLAARQLMVDNVVSAFRTGGLDSTGKQYTITDALAVPDSTMIIKEAITTLIQDSVEPNLIGHLLVDHMYMPDAFDSLKIHTIGALGEVDFFVPEAGEYPEISYAAGQGSVLHANIGKFGAKIKFTEEMIKRSQWNVMGMWVEKVVKAMARFKEDLIFKMILEQGTVVFDNVDTQSATIGRTLGRNIKGVGNGSMTASDLIDMYSHLLEQGYTGNVLLVHPLHWAMFAKDPIIREAGVARGDITQWLQSQVSPANPYKYLAGQTLPRPYRRTINEAEAEQVLQTTPNVAQFSPLSGLTVIPSPRVPYDKATKTASVIMLDSNNTGALITAETLQLDEWDEKTNDVSVVRVKERYGMVAYDDGKAIAIARNISLEPNEFFYNPQHMLTNVPDIVRKD